MIKSNRLINEKSPYLLQHANNPVDWYPWSIEAFVKAIMENKPIFLSIGYSTCHWCHVMEKESFEDNEIANMMNETFVNIKVDREERPDIDSIYMGVCQMLTGSGGWPLTIIMTPEQKPFFAGTYFPKNTMYGRIGMKDLVTRIGELWQEKQIELRNSAESIVNNIKMDELQIIDEMNIDELLNDACEYLISNFDSQYGGMKGAPKFPIPHNYTFLLWYWHSTGNSQAIKIVRNSLIAMRMGGIYDHVGGGFHRYSTDKKWLVPHFEKMLYDQALLLNLYSEAYAATKDFLFSNTAVEIIAYLQRDMLDSRGAFYSAEDADSEGVEGKFYYWRSDELKEILGLDYDSYSKYYSILPEGNFTEPHESMPDGRNILHSQINLDSMHSFENLTKFELSKKMRLLNDKLLLERNKRIRPHLDDKILVDWNGLLIAALSKASRLFQRNDFLTLAQNAEKFITSKMITEDGMLLHRYRNGESGITGMLDDYAYFIWGLIELYETTFDDYYIYKATDLADKMIELFWDNDSGGFFMTSRTGEKLISNKKEIYDGATPSGNSVALLIIAKLYRMTYEEKYRHIGDTIIKHFYSKLLQSPYVYTQFLSGLMMHSGNSLEIIIAGDRDSKETNEIVAALNNYYIPNKSTLLISDESKLAVKFPELIHYKRIDGKVTVYICRNGACQRPIIDIHELKNTLTELSKHFIQPKN